MVYWLHLSEFAPTLALQTAAFLKTVAAFHPVPSPNLVVMLKTPIDVLATALHLTIAVQPSMLASLPVVAFKLHA
jgi:hypothetical protein